MKTKSLSKYLQAIVCTFIILNSQFSTLNSASAQPLSYHQFIDTLMSRNKALAAQRLNVQVGEAEVTAARAFQDPSVTVEYGNNSDWLIAMGKSLSVELSKSFSLGKVSARTRLAKQSLIVAGAELDDYLRNLRADATVSFFDALLARDLAAIGQEAWQNVQALAASDSLRHARGDISELDMLQSRLEAHLAEQEWNSRATDYRNKLVQLDAMAGTPGRGTTAVEGSLGVPSEEYALQWLLDTMMQARADLLAARAGINVARSELQVTRRERMPDIDLSLGVSHNSRVLNEEAPAPEYTGYTVGVGIPLPVSNLNRGNVRAAQLRSQQAELQADDLEMQVKAEVVCAYNNYQAARERAKRFSTTLMENARQVLDGKLYAYRRGETSLLEVLNAQHTYNEIQEAYAECLHDCMVALTELQRAAGI